MQLMKFLENPANNRIIIKTETEQLSFLMSDFE